MHPLSERKPLEKSSLKDLGINKQVVQKAYLGKKTETVNNFNKLEIDLVLEQIIQLARVKRIFYNEEFDPGSG